MVQAARSSKQCIAEGAAQGTSLKNYLKMLGISRGSYEELLEDYEDQARLRNLAIWDQEGLRGFRSERIFIKDNEPLPSSPHLPQNIAVAINVMVDLITRENFLLDQQKRSLEKKFLQEGGYTEGLFKKRIEWRKRQITNLNREQKNYESYRAFQKTGREN